MAFQYTPFDASRYSGTIGELIARGGDIRARGAEQLGAIRAQQQAQNGQIWGGFAQNLGSILSRVPGQIRDQREAQQEGQLRQQKIASGAIDLGEKQAIQRGNAVMDGDQLPAGDVGPRQQSYLTPEGLFDIPKLNQALADSGVGHLAPQLLAKAEQSNAAITSHIKGEQEQNDRKAIILGDIADSVLTLHKNGVPLDQAMDSASLSALATKRIDPQQYAQTKAQVLQMPPDQQIAALTNLRAHAERIAPTKTLSEGAQETGRYGTVIAKGGDKPKNEAELAVDAAKGDTTAAAAMNILKPAPKRDDTQLALDAYAKSIGKPNAEALTYADRQTFEKNKVAITSSAAFQQHIREREYDNAHPAPIKDADQNKLEQQYRTVLQRAFSSRAGGIGSEDAKVQQANHLLALLDQTYDAKSDTYNIPKTLQGELAAGLARLVAPGGSVGIEMMREFDQKTAKGDIAGALSYVTGHPFPSATNDFAKLLKDSIERQGTVAEQNREGSMSGLRALAPTELSEDRRIALERANLNPLRQTKVFTNGKGERRLLTSVDGGTTWR